MNRTAAQTLDIRQDRMAHASEIVSQVGQAKLRWTEHPVHILYTDYSRPRASRCSTPSTSSSTCSSSDA